ncbi:hypothetical protein ABMC89_11325 [Sulfitobacter sp. HNIBRBA3233]|uniref:hypothetical protein n=1 Tax=Sulfitobacter marinivivus TaxID=3158558 RepID=UPI0032DE4AC7
MQQSQSAQTLYSNDQASTGDRLANAEAAILDVEEITLTSGNLETGAAIAAPDAIVNLVASDAPQKPGAPVDLAEDSALTVPTAQATAATDNVCDITAEARPIAAAMVQLTLDAPCMASERVTVLHSGLLFNEMTDAEGQLDVAMPAMAQDAMFVFAFSNGEGAVAQADVEEFSNFERVAVQWKGNTGFELHAREFGATYGEDGHVWSGAMRDMSFGVTGEGGYISQLGNREIADGLVAEVYTLPTRTTLSSGDIDLSVEAMVSEGNCGLEIEAQTFQTGIGSDIVSKDLTLSVPECDAAGNFLVLNNLFEDLKVASN